MMIQLLGALLSAAVGTYASTYKLCVLTCPDGTRHIPYETSECTVNYCPQLKAMGDSCMLPFDIESACSMTITSSSIANEITLDFFEAGTEIGAAVDFVNLLKRDRSGAGRRLADKSDNEEEKCGCQQTTEFIIAKGLEQMGLDDAVRTAEDVTAGSVKDQVKGMCKFLKGQVGGMASGSMCTTATVFAAGNPLVSGFCNSIVGTIVSSGLSSNGAGFTPYCRGAFEQMFREQQVDDLTAWAEKMTGLDFPDKDTASEGRWIVRQNAAAVCGVLTCESSESPGCGKENSDTKFSLANTVKLVTNVGMSVGTGAYCGYQQFLSITGQDEDADDGATAGVSTVAIAGAAAGAAYLL